MGFKLRGTRPRSRCRCSGSGDWTCTPSRAPAPGQARFAVRVSLSLCPRRAPLACSLVRSEPLCSARDESLQWHEFNSTLFILQPLYHVDSLTSTLLGGARGEAGGGGPRAGGGRGARGGGRSAPLPACSPGCADASSTPSARKEGGGGGGSGWPPRFGGAEGPSPAPAHPSPAPRPWSVPLAQVAKDGHLR